MNFEELFGINNETYCLFSILPSNLLFGAPFLGCGINVVADPGNLR